MIYFNPNNNLVNVSNSILKHFTNKHFNDTHKELDKVLESGKYKKVCVVLFDGMGTNIQKYHLPYYSIIKDNFAFKITSTFPPTTVAATTAFLSGKYPSETCFLGWNQYFKEYDKVIDMFSGNVTRSNPREKITPNPSYERFGHPTLLDLIKESGVNTHYVTHKHIAGKAKNIKDFFMNLDEAMKEDDSHFIYAYLNEPDHSIHDLGTKASKVKRVVKRLNRKLKIVCDNNKDNLVICLADHGLVDVKSEAIDKHKDLYDLIYTKAIDARCNAIYLKDKSKKELFKELFNKYYSNDFKIYEIEEVLSLKMFGVGTNHPDFKEFLGDYVIVSHSEKYFDLSDATFHFNGAHSGALLDERMINVSIINK